VALVSEAANGSRVAPGELAGAECWMVTFALDQAAALEVRQATSIGAALMGRFEREALARAASEGLTLLTPFAWQTLTAHQVARWNPGAGADAHALGELVRYRCGFAMARLT
jgi:hypothetical protein